MQNAYIKQFMMHIEKLNYLKRREVKWAFVLFLIFFSPSLLSSDTQLIKMEVIIKDVVDGTEEGYVLTDKGIYGLPGPGDEAQMEYKPLSILCENLKKAKDQKTTLYLYNNIIVGILSDNKSVNFKPDFTKRQKLIYTSPPLEIKTTMKKWNDDTYMLSIVTVDGTFCIDNSYDVVDYYNKVYQKLVGHYKKGEDLNVIIQLKYHKIEDGYECQGDIEDINFDVNKVEKVKE